MKKIIALFTCCAVFSTCFFCGCKQEETSKQEKNTSFADFGFNWKSN